MTKRNNYLFLLYQALMGNFRVHVKQAMFLHRNFFTANRTEVVQHRTLFELIRTAEREDSIACMKQTGISELGNCMLLCSTGRTALIEQEQGTAWHRTDTRLRCVYCIPQPLNYGIEKPVEVVSTVTDIHK